MLLRGDLLVNNVRCTLVFHILSGIEDQRGSLVEAQHQLALELCKASCFENGGSPTVEVGNAMTAGLSTWELLAGARRT